MEKKAKREFENVEEEVKFLRKQVAGYKGRNSSLEKIIVTKNDYIADLRGRLFTLSKEVERLNGLVEKYQEALKGNQSRPWWRFW